MEFILEEVLTDHILKKSKKGMMSCLKRFSCKSKCQINNEERMERLKESKDEFINLMKIVKRESVSNVIDL